MAQRNISEASYQQVARQANAEKFKVIQQAYEEAMALMNRQIG